MFEDLNRFARNDWSVRLDGRVNPNTGIDRGALRGLSPWNDPSPMTHASMAEKSASIGLASQNALDVAMIESRNATVRAAVRRASVGTLAAALFALTTEEVYRRGFWDTFTSWDSDPLTFGEIFSPSIQSGKFDLTGDPAGVIPLNPDLSVPLNLDIGLLRDKMGESGGASSGHRYLSISGLLPVAFYRRFHGSQPESGPTGSETSSWS
jgi:hypothetical protein